eukprot:TRINITY_DN9294_c0_g1_i1.p1 TRINITY_DN9294_c0_g1~~TRINITY_DN9294_c0_g1_i1.p1  ORF type:complete len:104 (+),score=13.27 TRINITY_DN9294_c0_g1_i1:85-396(+)
MSAFSYFGFLGSTGALRWHKSLCAQVDMKEFIYKWVGSKSDRNKLLISEAISIPMEDGVLRFREILGEYLRKRKPSKNPYLFMSVVRGEEDKSLKVDTIKSIC